MTFRLREADIERLFGEGPVDPELGSLAELIEHARVRFATRPPDEVRRRHLTAMRIARAQPRQTTVRARRPSFWPGVAAAAAGVALIAGVSLAAGGHLPGRLQDVASTAGHRIGFELPASNDGRPQHADDHQERAKAFTEAKREWRDCAREVRATEGADAEEVCGPKPHPHDFRQDDPTTEVSGGTTQPSEEPVSHGTPATSLPGHPGGQVSDDQGQGNQGQGNQGQGNQGQGNQGQGNQGQEGAQGPGQGEQGQSQEKGEGRSQGRGQGQQAGPEGNANEDREKAKKKGKPERG